MTDAYKCDVCGQFRIIQESYDYTSPARVTWTAVDAENKNIWHDIDLCENCAPSVLGNLLEVEKNKS